MTLRARLVEGVTMKSDLAINLSTNETTKIALLEQSNNYIYEMLQRLEKRFDVTDAGLSNLVGRIDKLDTKFDTKHDSLNIKMDSNNKWLIGLAMTILFSAATIGLSLFSIIKMNG